MAENCFYTMRATTFGTYRCTCRAKLSSAVFIDYYAEMDKYTERDHLIVTRSSALLSSPRPMFSLATQTDLGGLLLALVSAREEIRLRGLLQAARPECARRVRWTTLAVE